MALAHNVGNEVERAYNRTDALEKRRQMMEDWAAHALSGVGAAPGTVMTAGRQGIDVATGGGLLRITRLEQIYRGR